jgi:hypothetical protein
MHQGRDSMSTEAVPVLGQVAESARFLNDTIAKGAARLGGDRIPLDFFCECGDPDCRRVTKLTVGQYHNRRAEPLLAHSAALAPAYAASGDGASLASIK